MSFLKKPNTEDTIVSYISKFVYYLKYPIIFILYIYAFNYLFITNTLPLSFILLLILHIFILGIAYLDKDIVNYDDFNLDIFNADNNTNTPIDVLYKICQTIIYIIPAVSWVLLFVSLALVIHVLDRLGFYKNKSNVFQYLGNTYSYILYLIIIFFIISISILFILYGISWFKLIRNGTQVVNEIQSYDWITYTPIRLLSTTILLLSFITYYILTGYTENNTLSFGIGLCIVYYLINILVSKGHKEGSTTLKELLKNIPGKIASFDFKKINITSNETVYNFCIGFIIINLICSFILTFVFFEKSKELSIPFITWFLVSIYNVIVFYLFFKGNNNNVNIKYIVLLIIIILIVFTSITLYYSALLHQNAKMKTDG